MDILIALVLAGEVYISQGFGGAAPSHAGLDYYALDFIRLDPGGRSHRDNGQHNEDYYIWGAPILAAADGLVLAAADDTPDNEPYQYMEAPAQVAGNHIIIQHEAKVFTEYSHLMQGSLLVRPGQYVKAGQPIAQVGASGWAWEPHLHFQVQGGPGLGSQSVPWAFDGYQERREGVWAQREGVVPIKGDTIRGID